MQFLNRDGLNQTYTLSRVSLTAVNAGARIAVMQHPYAASNLKGNHSAKTELSLTYQDASNSQTVAVSAYLIDSSVSVNDGDQTKITVRNTYTLPTDFVGFIRKLIATPSGSINNLGAVSLFNMLDYSSFYTQQDSSAPDGCKVNYLFNRFVFQMPGDIALGTTITGSPYTNSTVSRQAVTGNMLCWGSNNNLGTVPSRLNSVPNAYARQLRSVGCLVECTALLDGHTFR